MEFFFPGKELSFLFYVHLLQKKRGLHRANYMLMDIK